MASILVVLIILGCAAYQYLKGTLVKSFATIIVTICASVVAFGYFEPLAKLLIERNTLIPWAQSLCFLVLFVLTFAILQAIALQLVRWPVELGLVADRAGRVVCGILTGFIISGVVITALAMAPLSNKIPYQRFDPTNPDTEKPHKALLNADGFATGWFNLLSKGSFSGNRSFATLHANFLNQLFLNRHKFADGVSIMTGSKAIEVPQKNAVWPASEELKDQDGKPMPPKPGHTLTIVRVGMTMDAMKYSEMFIPAQVRLVCKQKSETKNPLSGGGKSVYPIGYLKMANWLQTKQLNEPIKLERGIFEGSVKWIDFAFYVPNDSVPVLAAFKQNSIVSVPPPVAADQAPAVEPFFQLSECAKTMAELQPIDSAKIYGIELATGPRFLSGLILTANDPNQWQVSLTTRSIKPPEFKDGKINYVRAELKTEKPTKEQVEQAKKAPAPSRPAATQPGAPRTFTRSRSGTTQPEKEPPKSLSQILEPLSGYELLSLRCNNPPVGAAINGEQLPVLVEISGAVHCPVGVIVSGKVGDEYLCEFDYCGLSAKDTAGGLVITENGSIGQPFPDTIWITQEAQSIFDFYVLYMVKAGKNTFITSVKAADSQTAAKFKEYEGFFIK